jgi:exportin-1
MDQIRQDASTFEDPKTIKILRNVLKTNTSVCSSAGPIFGIQFGTIFPDLINLYEAANQVMNAQIAEKGKLFMTSACRPTHRQELTFFR